jgi:hypothetical protein
MNQGSGAFALFEPEKKQYLDFLCFELAHFSN